VVARLKLPGKESEDELINRHNQLHAAMVDGGPPSPHRFLGTPIPLAWRLALNARKRFSMIPK
jgi:hypothetical protein